MLSEHNLLVAALDGARMQVLKAVPGKLDPSHLLMVLSISLGKACGWLTTEEGFCFSFYPSFPDICFPGPDST